MHADQLTTVRITRRMLLRLLLPLLGGALPCGAALAAIQPLLGLPELQPWLRRGGDGVLRGPFIELSRELSSESGFRFHLYPAPYARLLAMLESGALDMMIAIPSPRLAALALEVVSLGAERVVIAVPAGVLELAQMRGRTVGQVRGTALAARELAGGGIVPYDTGSHVQGWHMFQMGRLDGVALPGTVFDRFIRAQPKGRPCSALAVRLTTLSLYWSKHSATLAWAPALRSALRACGDGQLLPRVMGREPWIIDKGEPA